MKELMQELVEAMVESAIDELGNGYPVWGSYEGGGLWVLTNRSRDPRRSRNGGEYDAYTEFEIRPDGIQVYETLSCELISIEEYKDRSARHYPILMTANALERQAHLAEAWALCRIAPDEALDPNIAVVIKAATELVSKKIGFKEFKVAVRSL